METVLVIGATGNVGASAILAALNTGRSVIAVVRNASSADKLYRNVGTREGITTVEADVTSLESLKGVVEKVERGDLPAFQHVYSAGKRSMLFHFEVILLADVAAAGGLYGDTPLLQVDVEELRTNMVINFESNLCEILEQ